MYRLFLFGSPRLQVNEQWITLKTQKTLGMLCYLALTQQPQSRETLATLFWPDSDTKRGNASMRRALYNLRKLLGDDIIKTERQLVWVSSNLWVDVCHFRQLTAQSQHSAWAEAASLYEGRLMTGFSLQDSLAFDEWQLYETEMIQQEVHQLLQDLVIGYTKDEQWEEAIQYAQQQLSLNVLDETTHQQLMWLYAEAGQKTAVRRQYKKLTDILQTELGIEPSLESQEIYQICLQTIKKRVSAPPQTPTPPHISLPYFATSFIGRTNDLNNLQALLQQPDKQLISLVGLGGMGKTRLAVQTAKQSKELFSGGIAYCDLVPLHAEQSLLPTIAQAIGLHPKQQLSLLKQIVKQLQVHPYLLILDNFEHLLAQKNEIAELLTHLPNLTLLVTSREPLNLDAEWVYLLSGLLYDAELEEEETAVSTPTLPTPTTHYPANLLFITRARQQTPHFDVRQAKKAIQRICQLVEGMPLGIELAAAWSRALTCEQIVTEIQQNLDLLSDPQQKHPIRHQNIRAVFESSWQHLSLAEQTLLAQLSLFRGSFSHTAMMHIAQPSLFTLYSLVNKVFVRQNRNGRYDLHPLVRQFAQEKLAQQNQYTTYKQQFILFYAQFTQTQNKHLSWQDNHEALAQLGSEINNISQAWEWAAQEHQYEQLSQMKQGLYQFYSIRGQYQKGYEQFKQATTSITTTSLSHQPQSDALLAYLWATQGEFLYALGHQQRAHHSLEQALSFAQQVKQNSTLNIRCLRLLGTINYQLGRYAPAKQALSQALTLAKQDKDKHIHALLRMTLGAIEQALGNLTLAKAHFEAAHKQYMTLGYDWGLAHVTRFLGTVARLEGAYTKAETHLQKSLQLCQKLDHHAGEALTLNELGLIFQEKQQWAEAEAKHLYSHRLGEATGVVSAKAVALQNIGRVKWHQQDHVQSEKFLYDALQEALLAESPPLILDILADIAQQLPNGRQATSLAQLVTHHPASQQTSRARVQAIAQQQLPSATHSYSQHIQDMIEKSQKFLSMIDIQDQ